MQAKEEASCIGEESWWWRIWHGRDDPYTGGKTDALERTYAEGVGYTQGEPYTGTHALGEELWHSPMLTQQSFSFWYTSFHYPVPQDNREMIPSR